jgi:hypothetical protein
VSIFGDVSITEKKRPINLEGHMWLYGIHRTKIERPAIPKLGESHPLHLLKREVLSMFSREEK